MNSSKALSKNLLSLSTQEVEELTERIKRWNGKVRMFVHPMYEKWGGKKPLYRDDPKGRILLDIEHALARLTSKPLQDTPPIIIVEEKVHLSKLDMWMSDHSNQPIYVVPSNSNNPTPYIERPSMDPLIKQMVKIPSEEAWKVFIAKLSELQIRTILLGGVYFEVNQFMRADWTAKKPFVARCVGIALSYLAKTKAGLFDVELSALTAPSNERSVYLKYMKEQTLVA